MTGTTPEGEKQLEFIAREDLEYQRYCAGCHGIEGVGLLSRAYPRVGNRRKPAVHGSGVGDPLEEWEPIDL